MFEYSSAQPSDNSPRKASTSTTCSLPTECDLLNDSGSQFGDFMDVIGTPQEHQTTEVAVPVQHSPVFIEFPCSECGAIITMQVLDQHMGQCPNAVSHVGLQPVETTDLIGIGDAVEEAVRNSNAEGIQLMQFEEDEEEYQFIFDQLPDLHEQAEEPMPNITINPGWMIDQPFSVEQPDSPVMPPSPALHPDPMSQFPLPSIQNPPMGAIQQSPFSIHIQFQNDSALLYIITNNEPSLDSLRTYIDVLVGLLSSRRPKPTLTEAEIEAIPRAAYSQDSHSYASCTVCQLEFEEGQLVMELPCGHIFGEDCLKPWLAHSTSCPNCRASVN